MQSPHGLNHLAIGSADPERLARFYENVLGLRRIHAANADGQVRAIWFQFGAGVLMIERATEAVEGRRSAWAGGVRPGFHLLSINIEKTEVAGQAERLAAAGVSIVRRSEFTLYFTDPDGNPLGLSWFDAAEFLSGAQPPG